MQRSSTRASPRVHGRKLSSDRLLCAGEWMQESVVVGGESPALAGYMAVTVTTFGIMVEVLYTAYGVHITALHPLTGASR